MAPPLAIPLRIEGTLEGTACACDGQVLQAISPRAYPPGRPIELTLLLAGGELSLSARTLGSKKRADAGFDLRVRLTNLRREARELLERAFSVER